MIQTVICPTSCGLVLLRGEREYKTPEVYFKDMATLGMHKSDFTQFLYTHSETGHPEIGDKIAKYIHDNQLGFVVKSKPGGNPIHQGREISVWVWTRDNNNFRKHCQELLSPKDTICNSSELKAVEPLNSTASVVSAKAMPSRSSANSTIKQAG